MNKLQEQSLHWLGKHIFLICWICTGRKTTNLHIWALKNIFWRAQEDNRPWNYCCRVERANNSRVKFARRPRWAQIKSTETAAPLGRESKLGHEALTNCSALAQFISDYDLIIKGWCRSVRRWRYKSHGRCRSNHPRPHSLIHSRMCEWESALAYLFVIPQHVCVCGVQTRWMGEREPKAASMERAVKKRHPAISPVRRLFYFFSHSRADFSLK
jgi:hypothetical protein